MFSKLKTSPNKIHFKTMDKRIKAYSLPKPSSKCIPNWLKSLTKDAVDENGGHGGTVKRCMPFLDAVTSGYVLTAPADLVITGFEVDGVKEWSTYWKGGSWEEQDIVQTHHPKQLTGEPLLKLGNIPLMMTSFFCIETPKGYSTLFTPVLNNHELSLAGITFLSAVVETDNYYGEVNLPFLFSNFTGEEITIKKGTPLVQLLPFKRESWEMEVSAEDESYFESNHMALYSKLKESYRVQYHKKKTYR